MAFTSEHSAVCYLPSRPNLGEIGCRPILHPRRCPDFLLSVYALYAHTLARGTATAMEKQERKRKIGSLPETTEGYKKRFIEKLEKGYSARVAAKMIDVARRTVSLT